MPSPTERRRNNIRAGVFVTLGILLTVVTVVTLSGVWGKLTRRTETYTVRYPVASGVDNLQPGSEVRIGGVRMGAVRSIRPYLVDGGPFEQIDVDFAVDATVPIYEDARIFVSSPILGTDSWLDIPDVGSAGPATGQIIMGAPSAGLLSTMLGPDNASRADDILENAREFAAHLGDDGMYTQRIADILANTDDATANVKQLTDVVADESWPAWSTQVSEILDWTTEFRSQIDGAVADARGVLDESRAIVDENRPSIRTIVDNVEMSSGDIREVASRVKDETIEKLNALLGSGERALADAEMTLGTMRTDYEQWAVELGEVLGNATLASQQLKLTMIEVRRSPWKVLYRPTEKELEHELLYDAARSFALATADLKAASQSVNAILANHATTLEEDPELLARVKRNLLDPLANYEQAQEKLLDVLFETTP